MWTYFCAHSYIYSYIYFYTWIHINTHQCNAYKQKRIYIEHTYIHTYIQMRIYLIHTSTWGHASFGTLLSIFTRILLHIYTCRHASVSILYTHTPLSNRHTSTYASTCGSWLCTHGWLIYIYTYIEVDIYIYIHMHLSNRHTSTYASTCGSHPHVDSGYIYIYVNLYIYIYIYKSTMCRQPLSTCGCVDPSDTHTSTRG